jgi:hypothetical protein
MRSMGLVPGFLAGVMVLMGAGPPATPTAKPVEVTLRGKVVTLGSALRALGMDVPLDPEAATGEVVLLGEDRTITPLFRDEATRALFVDERLRDCRAELHGRRSPGVPYLQVSTVRVERDGRFQTPEYFCGVCAISVRAPQICPCCQGPMELRMKPDRR